MSGLKVVSRGDKKTCEHVCGSGNPGTLYFTG